MHRVAFVVYPGFELLDMAGPAAVFDGANHVLAQRGKAPFYAVEIISAEGGLVASRSGVAVHSLRRSASRSKPVDTLLIAGAQREHLLRGGSGPGPAHMASAPCSEGAEVRLGLLRRIHPGGSRDARRA